jgi:hypothetical protein
MINLYIQSGVQIGMSNILPSKYVGVVSSGKGFFEFLELEAGEGGSVATLLPLRHVFQPLGPRFREIVGVMGLIVPLNGTRRGASFGIGFVLMVVVVVVKVRAEWG